MTNDKSMTDTVPLFSHHVHQSNEPPNEQVFAEYDCSRGVDVERGNCCIRNISRLQLTRRNLFKRQTKTFYRYCSHSRLSSMRTKVFSNAWQPVWTPICHGFIYL